LEILTVTSGTHPLKRQRSGECVCFLISDKALTVLGLTFGTAKDMNTLKYFFRSVIYIFAAHLMTLSETQATGM
jgi:hypothetical protein